MRANFALGASATAAALLLLPAIAVAQQQPTEPGWPLPIQNNPILGYASLNQNELRIGDGTTYRWDGEGWYGGNLNRLWVKSEGNLETSSGATNEAEVQALYSRAISPFFNLQLGVRYDFDPTPSRGWAAFGVEGLAPLGWDIDAFVFASDGGYLGARLEGYYNLYLTQRLVLQPQFELNAYSRADRPTRTGTGLSDADFGLRLRYQIRREFAPYIGVTYATVYGSSADFARETGHSISELRFVVGIHAWL
ncbi:MAG: copper resistance protein B [Steroidobacteraceae bacterium]